MQFRTERLIEYKTWQGECAPGLVTEIIAVCWNPKVTGLVWCGIHVF